jgi:hypothetical protein
MMGSPGETGLNCEPASWDDIMLRMPARLPLLDHWINPIVITP